MNNKLIRFYVFLFLNLFVSQINFAHDGGHYRQGDLFRIWHLKNGQKIQGNFLKASESDITLEQLAGHIVKIPVSILTQQDQKFAHFKIQKYFLIHKKYVFQPFENTHLGLFKSRDMGSWIQILKQLCFLFLIILIFNQSHQWISRGSFYGLLFFSFIFACKTATDLNPSSTTNVTTITPVVQAKTSTAFIDSAFAPYKNQISTNWDETYFYVNSTGIPTHNMMVGITAWQQQVPIPQLYSGTNHWSITLKPVYATTPLSTKSNFMKGAIALAVNGIPIFNALNNRGEDSFIIGELDQWGGHCGKADDYHYHAAPLHLSSISGLKPIAFALDGYAVYGAKEPDGSTMKTLDISHGHEGSGGVYHYHGTADYPYVVGSMKGKVTSDPSTPAPENQIIPQAFANSVRPALTPLSGASITDFKINSPTNYTLTYKIGSKFGSVNYLWNATNLYTFNLTNVDGKLTTSTYQRK